MHRAVQFMSLPVELMCNILSFLDSVDLVRCTVVTKRLRKAILESSRLQYTIELAKHRMVPLLPPSAAPPYVSRLKILLDRERAWKTLRWNGRYNLKLPPTGSVYEFVGGLYGNGREDDRRVTASISFLELPTRGWASCEKGDGAADLKTWMHPMSDIIIIDFTMDPSQDMLVLVALAEPGSKYVYDVHLRTLSTNEPHPRAPLSSLPCLLKPAHTLLTTEHIAAVRVQVSGDLVALLVKEIHDGIGAHLEIWDWINNPQASCKLERRSGIDDFTFLTKDAFLIVRPVGSFEVYTFENPITGAAPSCRATYALPPLSEGYMYWYITMSSNPAPGSVPQPNLDPTAMEGRERQTYYPKPDERIHACCLYVFNPAMEDTTHRVHCFVFFVNIHSLLRPPAEWLQHKRPRYKQTGKRRQPSSSSDTDSSRATSQQVPLPVGNSTSTGSSGTSSTCHSPCGISRPESLQLSFSSPNPTTASSSTLSPHSTASTSMSTSNAPSLPFPMHLPDPVVFSVRPPLYSPTAPPTPLTAYIPWSVWGPQSTRWFQECISTDWQHSIYGLRTIECVTPEKLGYPAGSSPPPLDPCDHHGRDVAPDTSTPSTWNGQENGAASSAAGVTTAQQAEGTPERSSSATNSSDPPVTWRHLRLRDYNPYAIMEAQREESEGANRKGKGKHAVWGAPRVVTEPSTTKVRGVFKHDVTSCLPYVEVVSQEMFEVTDVMMDDCRLLLLKRGENGRLKRMDVLTM
ncbi:hypothetical protein LshimejAT787_1103920 [Lyophyllum shimeji]|uniref:F-box domain-containing protein n=1 Tax=Lyophyllum shimeji TaxID=47721 RepID=A0A9P3PW67_LYOSH|nr:hypothetical protein LshimejAT787_1103920 [Lyophyllum shimeji]